jgi:hypothetical protein
MKKILFVVAAMCISLSGYSQFFEIGPRFEVVSTKFQLDRSTLESIGASVDEASRDLGFKVGLYSRVKIGSIYLQPEILFTSTGGKVTFDDDNAANTANQIIDLNYNRIDLPLMIGKKFGKVFRFNLGPVLSYTVSDKAELEDAVLNVEDVDYNEAVIGYQIGIGFDISKLRLDVKYEGNLSNFGERITISETLDFPTEFRPNMFTFGLAFNLL